MKRVDLLLGDKVKHRNGKCAVITRLDLRHAQVLAQHENGSIVPESWAYQSIYAIRRDR